jgi:ABC-2 type transport system ATP-binding protein
MIAVNNLNKSYGNKEVLKSINLTFNKGEVVGIVGENGAGKSTLFKCITQMEAFEGEVIYDGGVLKNVCGFLPTDPYFMSHITGQEYLRFLCNARGIEASDIDNKNIFDLPLNQYADTYSTGMKKKLALTGVLLQKNEVFILDEPFNGVDIHSNIVIKEVIAKLKALNKIVILSSHIFSTLAETCDYLHYLKDGEIVKSVGKAAFEEVKQEMLATGLQHKIDELDLG